MPSGDLRSRFTFSSISITKTELVVVEESNQLKNIKNLFSGLLHFN